MIYIAPGVALIVALLAYIGWQKKQIDALIANELVAGRTRYRVPAWQISGRAASMLIGLIFLVVSVACASAVWWFNSPLTPDTWAIVRTFITVLGFIVTGIMAIIAIVGFTGGLQ